RGRLRRRLPARGRTVLASHCAHARVRHPVPHWSHGSHTHRRRRRRLGRSPFSKRLAEDLMALTQLKPEVEADPPQPHREGPLSIADEHRLSRRWRTLEDKDALARLVQAHLGLVIRIATEFRHSGPSMEDLIQEGNLGLTIA